jgi:phenylacetate-CoA ligase
MPAINWRAPLYRCYEERLQGRRTFRYLDLMLELQWRSEEHVRAFQWSELKRLLKHSYEHVHFHRRRFQALGITPNDIQSPDDYARLPLLEKRDFAESQEQLLADNADRDCLTTNGSGGSTGEPMRYKHDRDSYEWRQAAHLRGNMWAGSGLGRREFHLWGEPMKKTPGLKEMKRRAWHFALNHHYADAYELTEERMGRYLAEFNRLKPDVLIGYSHSLALFARFVRNLGGAVWSPRGVIGTAEKLQPEQREIIESVFGAPLFDRYGCREVMLVASECEEHRGMHVTADNLYVEILVDGRAARPGETGEVVVTDLHNYAMPFLRYRNGDLATASDRKCSCGRGLPLIEEMCGRTLDVLRTPEGRSISGVFVPMFFKDYAWVEEFQLEQTAIDLIEVRIKPAVGYHPELLPHLQQDLQRRIGASVRLDYQVVDKIPRTATGKHRPVISRLPQEEPRVLAA